MSHLTETLSTPIAGTYDAIVVGAGPAGCGAALACARQGLKTLLVDRFNALGGMWTLGFMNPLFDFENKHGILTELISDLRARGEWGGFWNESFNYEYMKQLLDEKMRDAGVTVRLNTLCCRTLTEGKTVTGIVTEAPDGRRAYYGRMIFDCTGDGHVAANAGCAYEIGEDGDIGACQAMTLMFLVGNIPEKYADGLMIGKILDACYEKAGKVAPFHNPYLIPAPNARFGVMQFTHMFDYDPLSEDAVAAATAEGRRQMIEAYELLKAGDPDFRNLELICSAPVLGVRESRRIVGEYTLTADDLLAGRTFEDGICPVTFLMDVHSKKRNTDDCRDTPPYEIPFRCLIPKDYEGILVAGRCISGTHQAMASYRVTGNCCQMGENAGILAAYALRTGTPIREVPVKEVLENA